MTSYSYPVSVDHDLKMSGAEALLQTLGELYVAGPGATANVDDLVQFRLKKLHGHQRAEIPRSVIIREEGFIQAWVRVVAEWTQSFDVGRPLAHARYPHSATFSRRCSGINIVRDIRRHVGRQLVGVVEEFGVPIVYPIKFDDKARRPIAVPEAIRSRAVSELIGAEGADFGAWRFYCAAVTLVYSAVDEERFVLVWCKKLVDVIDVSLDLCVIVGIVPDESPFLVQQRTVSHARVGTYDGVSELEVRHTLVHGGEQPTHADGEEYDDADVHHQVDQPDYTPSMRRAAQKRSFLRVPNSVLQFLQQRALRRPPTVVRHTIWPVCTHG